MEPVSLLIKRKGGNLVDIDEWDTNIETSTTVIAYEMSRRNLGPKIYGLFEGGSVDEYVDSHPLTYEESTDPEISRDIALSLAATHAIKGLPLKQTGFETNMKLVRNWSRMISKEFILNDESIKNSGTDIDFLLNFNFDKETDWLIKISNELKMRKNFVIFDTNYCNCLVRNYPKTDEKRILLIDYDLGQYNYRGIDIGMHFFNRRFDPLAEDPIIKGGEFFTTEHKRRFIQIYQQEIKRLNIWNDFDENGIDSIDNILMESTIGQCIANLLLGTFMTKSVFLSKYPQVVEFYLRHYLMFKGEIERIAK